MPESPATYLDRITLTLVDELYSAIKEASVAKGTFVEALMIEYIQSGLGLGATPRIPVEMVRETLIKEMKLYAEGAFNGSEFLMQSDDGLVIAVLAIGQIGDKRFADTGIIARIVNDIIVIEHDMNDKPLVDALMQAGIPRAQIILAYAGEPTPKRFDVFSTPSKFHN